MVATTLQLLDDQGADAPVWRRFGRDGWHTPTAALDNPDGDRLLAVERQAVAAARRARGEAEREESRPACRHCSAPFSDERWEENERAGTTTGCAPAAARPTPRPRPPRRSASAPGGAGPDPASPTGRPLTCGGEFGHPC
ncbi:hypothetical protein [Kitasatospora mediocidica]|uniref:hypothetical protein n=1 Tax=Kitasatospora mediocidica TaxID=58352 RepID=UPI0012F8FC76|nr:hypothetical protein [Kitasatospora mediocidica]